MWASSPENQAAPGEIYKEQEQSRGDRQTDGQTKRCLDSGQKKDDEAGKVAGQRDGWAGH